MGLHDQGMALNEERDKIAETIVDSQADPGSVPRLGELGEDAGRRATRIYQDWKRACRQPARGILWRNWNFSGINALIVVCLVFVLPDLEYVFWGSDGWHWFIRFFLAWHHPSGLGAVILLFYPINILLVESYVNLRTPRRHQIRSWLLWLRALLSGVPILGLHVIPGWRWLLQKHPVWVYRDEPSEDLLPSAGDVQAVSGLSEVLRRSQSSIFFLFWLTSANMLVVHLAVSDLSASAWMTLWRRSFICILLHLSGFACTASFLLEQHRQLTLSRWKLIGLCLVTSLWFLPQPLAFFSLATFVLSGRGWNRQPTILSSADDISLTIKGMKQEVGHYWQRQPAWRRWRGPWGLEKEKEVRDSERRLAALCRGKTFLLVVDGMAVTQFLGGLALSSRGGIVIALLLFLAIVLLMVLSTISIFLVLGGRVHRTIRFGFFSGSHSQSPGLDYLLLTQAAFMAGVFLGIPLALDRVPWLALAMVLVGGMYILFDLGGMSDIGIGKWENLSERLFWVAIFIQVLGSGYFMAVYPWTAELVEHFLRWTGRNLLVWALLLGLIHSSALLHPAGWRELWSSDLPKGTRWLMAMMLVSAWVPLGGLMIPLWFYGRKRLRSAGVNSP